MLVTAIVMASITAIAQLPVWSRPVLPPANEKFEPNLAHLESVDEVMSALDDANANATQIQKLDAADALLRKRFMHAYSYFRIEQNWMAAALRPLWDDLASPVRPDDILKFRRAACSQQAIVFQEIARRLGFEFASVRAPGHFLAAVKIDGEWWVYDANKEVAVVRYPLHMLLRADPTIVNLYTPGWGELLVAFTQAGQINLIDVNENPAKEASLLHGILAVSSIVGWLIPLLLYAALRPLPLWRANLARNLTPRAQSLFVGYPLCRVFGHKRDLRNLTLNAGTWRSRCRHCDGSLIRLRKGRWIQFADLQEYTVLLLGPAFEVAWPVVGSSDFDELLLRVNDADKRRSVLSMHGLRSFAQNKVSRPTCSDLLSERDCAGDRKAA